MNKINKISGVYCFKNKINSKKYIGQSCDINRRYKRHLRELREDKSPNKILQMAWNKYGEENFEFKIIEECEEKDLDEKEIYWIKTLESHSSENGYNISWGGNAPMKNVPVTDEHRKKLSIASSGKNNGMYGKKLSPETLMKISKALKGKPHTEEAKMNNSLGQVGKRTKNKKCKYIGVSKHKDGGFVSRIKNVYTKERIYLGYFKTELDAALAYDKKSWEIYKDTSKLNFPDNFREDL